jgi:GMP synthase-like glutamine amidotransferase
MRGILVIEHTEGDGPGHFGEWLAAHGRPMTLVRVHAGDAVPLAIGAHAGLCVLGGPMSANDVHLPHIRDELVLVRDALERRVPMIGHCLGGQLLAKTLGATIGASPKPEIGWHAIEIADDPFARRWFGDTRAPVVMQWHYEAFTLPSGARALAGMGSRYRIAGRVGAVLQLHCCHELRDQMPKMHRMNTNNDHLLESQLLTQSSVPASSPRRVLGESQCDLVHPTFAQNI